MSHARCTLSVRGLDCPNEVAVLRDALKGEAGISQLGFDLINGMMTVDYQAGVTSPEALLSLVRDRARMQASIVGREESKDAEPTIRWWSRHGRLASTIASGIALGLGVAIGWLGMRVGLEAVLAERIAQGLSGFSPGRSIASGTSGSTSTY